MRKPLTLLVAVVLVAAMVVPAVAVASGGRGFGSKSEVQSSRGTEVAPVERASNGQAVKPFKQASPAAGKPLKAEAKAARKAAKAEAKAAKAEAKAIRKGLPSASLESSPTSPSAEATKAVGAGVANALRHIVANIMRKLEKFGADRVSPGLKSVWEKFSWWLGEDTTVKPWETSSTVAPSGDASQSVLPPVFPSLLTTPPAQVP